MEKSAKISALHASAHAAMNEILEELYLSAAKPSSLGGINRLWKEARKQIPGLKKEDTKKFLHTQYPYTRHRPARRKLLKRKVIASNINDVYQLHLVDMQKFAEFNNGVKYILTMIDCFSLYAFAVPLKSKKLKKIIEAMATVFKKYGIPLKIFTDKVTEFLNKDVEAFLRDLNILQWYSYDPGKAVMAERLPLH